MTIRVRKNDARQGERRPFQERILFWSILVAATSLGAVALAVMLAMRGAG